MNWYTWKQGNLAYAPNCLVDSQDEGTIQAVSMDDEHGHWVHLGNGLYALSNPKSED
jgi:hypothetical protein